MMLQKHEKNYNFNGRDCCSTSSGRGNFIALKLVFLSLLVLFSIFHSNSVFALSIICEGELSGDNIVVTKINKEYRKCPEVNGKKTDQYYIESVPTARKMCPVTSVPTDYVVTGIRGNSSDCARMDQYDISHFGVLFPKEICSVTPVPPGYIVTIIDGNGCSTSSVPDHRDRLKLLRLTASSGSMCSGFGVPSGYYVNYVINNHNWCDSVRSDRSQKYDISEVSGRTIKRACMVPGWSVPPGYGISHSYGPAQNCGGNEQVDLEKGITNPDPDPDPGPNPDPDPNQCFTNSGSPGSSIMPDNYQESGVSGTRENIGNPDENEYIDPLGGGLQLQYSDITIPGNGGQDINIVRSYNHYNERKSHYGIGWDVHFGRLWAGETSCLGTGLQTSEQNPVLELPGGGRQLLVDAHSASGPNLISTNNWAVDCKNGEPVAYSPAGDIYDFSSAGVGDGAFHVTRITDKNGNTLDIEYTKETTGTLGIYPKKITSNDGREISFVFKAYKPVAGPTYKLLDNIQVGSGTAARTVRYSYEERRIDGHSEVGTFNLTNVERPDGSKYTYSYFGDGASRCAPDRHVLKSVKNPLGLTTSYNYQAVEFTRATGTPTYRMIKQKITDGKTWSYAFSPGSNGGDDSTTVNSPEGKRTTYKHYGVSTATWRNGTVWKIGVVTSKKVYTGSSLKQSVSYNWDKVKISQQDSYDRNNSGAYDIDTYMPVLSKRDVSRDGTNYITTYTDFDGFGSPKKTVESGAGSRTTTNTYINKTSRPGWQIGLPDVETIQGIGTTNYDYDGDGNLILANKYGVKTSYTYYSSGDVNTVKDPNGNVITYGLTNGYRRGIARSEKHPEGYDVLRNVGYFGNVTRETKEGNVTDYRYDSLNRPTSEDKPLGATTTWRYRYTSPGIERVETRGSFSETSNFDARGLLKQKKTGGITTKYNYDAFGRKTFQSYPSSSSGDTFSYDVLDRLKSITHPDNKTVVYSYTSGNTQNIKNERGVTTSYVYQSFGDPGEKYLKKIVSPENITTTIPRNDIGNITSISQGGLTRSYTYDTRQYLKSITNPETGTTVYTRDDNGNLKTSKVGLSGTTIYTYDGQNRVENINYPTGTDDVDFTYYPQGEVRTITRGATRWEYSYDNNRNLKKESLSAAGKGYSIDYGYDNKDALSSIKYPDNTSVSLSPDGLGRPTRVSGYVSSVDYYPNNQVKTIRLSNGVTTNYGQDSRLRVSSISTGNSLVNLGYGYDGVGNVENITDAINSLHSKTLIYDDVNRLKTVNGASIGYDAAGNIRSKQTAGQSLTYNYDSGTNLLTSVSGKQGYTFSYDKYGNVTNNGHDQFQYDAASNLTSVTSKSIDYAYDGNNRRTLKTENGITKYSVYSADGSLMYEDTPKNGEKIKYIYLNGQVIAKNRTCDDRDSDSDGIPDCYEKIMGLDPNDSTDASADPDADGLNNLEEYSFGTSHLDSDSDDDGLPDGYEVDNALDPLTDTDAAKDQDNDGLSTLDEFQYGTDPHNADTDNDGVTDGEEIANGTDPNFNVAVMIPIYQLILD